MLESNKSPNKELYTSSNVKKHGKTRALLKTPKGTVDYLPWEMAIREQLFETIRRIFKRHGAVTIETPVFELRDVLMGKYGEDSKLIYDLQDQGGEICSLRYDLTVPFARFLATNNIRQIKRYQIARVYRRDQPVLSRGRYREFYQCDFDVAGESDSMLPDAECLRMMAEILTAIDLGSFTIKLNHRLLLDGIFELCGVPQGLYRPICSAIDKLDKESWAKVEEEMVKKGLAPEVAARIKTFVQLRGKPEELLRRMREERLVADSKSACQALDDLELLLVYTDAMDCTEFISLDLSLARGLDYYTGLIYEAVTDGDVGSVAAGGRYDELVGMFSGKPLPAVGFSVGIERLFALLSQRAKQRNGGKIPPSSPAQVYVSAVPTFVKGDGAATRLLCERMSIAQTLWSAEISAVYSYKRAPKLASQLKSAAEEGIPIAVIIGDDELNQNKVKVKNLINGQQVEINRSEMVDEIRRQLKAIRTSPLQKEQI